MSRRKFKNSYEYECSFLLGENVGMKNEKWIQMMSADNAWISRSELMESHQKMVAEVDMKEALASGQFRPLVRKEIEQHCAGFDLDAELVSHSRMRGLSGGQRVKVCLAACTWQRPHLIVLDEPTNFLDRDSLGALSKGLKDFGGGVIIITHSAEFTKGLTEEVWACMAGRMYVQPLMQFLVSSHWRSCISALFTQEIMLTIATGHLPDTTGFRDKELVLA